MAGMRIITSKSKVMVLSCKRLTGPIGVREELLPPSGGVQISQGLVHYGGGWLRDRSDQDAVMWMLHSSVGVRREMNLKAKLSVYMSI